MAFAPAFKAQFASALAEQAMAIVQRDFTAALAGITPPAGRTYNPIASYRKNLLDAMNSPELVVAVRLSAFTQDDNLHYRQQAHRLLLRPFIADADPEFCAQAAYDYIRALDQVMTTASGSDWMNPLPLVHNTRVAPYETAGLGANGAQWGDAWVETHDYGVLWEAPQGFGMRPSLTLMVQLIET